MSNTLLVFLHGIGDNIMLTGVLGEYCRLHPEEKIDLAVLNPACQEIWKNNPLVGNALLYPARQPQFWNPVKYYLLHQWKARRLIRRFNREGMYQKILFPTIQTFPELAHHITRTGCFKYYRLCKEMGVDSKPYPYELYLPSDAVAAGLVGNLSAQRLAVLHPFSTDAHRRMADDEVEKNLIALQARGFTTLVVGSAKEKSQVHPSWKTAAAFGLSLGNLVEVLKHAEVFCGADSMVGHLAAFANVPKIIIHSNAWEPQNYRPLSEHGRVLLLPLRKTPKSERAEAFRQLLDAM
jgi:ADP-heptose:LPS heptosyltransferase